jgi:cytosine deaminase
MGAEDHLRANGVKVEVAQNAECAQLMRDFIAKNPQLWNEDIGV